MSLASRFAPLLCVAAFAPACIIATSPADDDDGSGGTTGFGDTSAGAGPGEPNPSTTGDTPESDTGDPSGTTTGGGPTGECTANLLQDGGFETGTPNDAWSASSEAFGTPICDSECSEDPSAVPYAGNWWVWMGGTAMAETASVSQSLVIDPSTAYLSFRFQINDSAGAGTDVFTASIDGETVFMATDAEQADYDSYRLVQVDVSDFADGAPHQVVFSAEIAGSGTDQALTNFFLDDVELVSCTPEGGDDGTSSGSEGDGSTGGDESSSGSDGPGSSTGGDSSGSSGSTSA